MVDDDGCSSAIHCWRNQGRSLSSTKRKRQVTANKEGIQTTSESRAITFLLVNRRKSASAGISGVEVSRKSPSN